LRAFARRKRSGLDWPHRPETFGRAFRGLVGGILVTIGVAWELVEEYQAYGVGNKTRDDNAQIVALLTDEAKTAEEKIAADDRIANQAAKDAAGLGVTVGNLHDNVAVQESRIRSINSELNVNQAAAKKVQTDVVALNNLEQQNLAMSRQALATVAAENAPRIFNERGMADALKNLPKIPIDFGISRGDADSNRLATLIAGAAVIDGWTIQAWKDDPKWEPPHLPTAEDLVQTGVMLVFTSDDSDKFFPAAKAIVTFLRAANIPAISSEIAPSIPFSARLPSFGLGEARPGALHILVGTRR
jgi:hypothetical protein